MDDLGLGQQVEIGADLGPRAVAAERGERLYVLGGATVSIEADVAVAVV